MAKCALMHRMVRVPGGMHVNGQGGMSVHSCGQVELYCATHNMTMPNPSQEELCPIGRIEEATNHSLNLIQDRLDNGKDTANCLGSFCR